MYLNIFETLDIYKEIDSYDDEYPTNPNGTTIISSFNSSPGGWWTWDTHGSVNDITVKSRCINLDPKSAIDYSNNTNGLRYLHNTNKYGIISSNSCHVGNFSETNSMVDAALFNTYGGAVAMAGNTDVGWYSEGQKWLYELTEAIYNTNNGTSSTPRYCSAALSWLNSSSPIDFDRYETYLTNNYFGDPEMMYYTKEPTKLLANVTPRHITLTENNTITITITNLLNNHTATVCLYQAESNYQEVQEVTGTSNNSVNVSFTISAERLLEGTLHVTVSGFNFIPFSDEIIISPSCTYILDNPKVIDNTPPFAWSGVEFYNRDIIVKSGAVLTITGDVYFVPEAKLIVEPGAKLIIDGGVLGASCENLWLGIEVWGHNKLSQFNNNQGEVNIINGGVVKEAICGIKTFKGAFIGYDVYNTGGIIKCSNAIFENNKTAVNFHPYYYSNLPNQGYFKECNFSWDDRFMIPDPLTGNPEEMVSLHGLNLINFTNCKFINSMSTSVVTKRGYAIKVNNSNLSFKGSDNTIDLSQIEGFYYGIHGTSVNPRIVKILNTTFKNNLRGVYCANQSTIVTITKNQFYTRIGNNTETERAYGLYLDNTTGYSVQENNFTGNFKDIVTYETGVIINNSGSAPNEIYNNKFSYLQNGITAQNNNRSSDGITGLVCKCNEFTGNQTDESVLLDTPNPKYGMAESQGDGLSLKGPAGNTFSSHPIGSFGDITNNGAHINYCHHKQTSGLQYRVEPLYYNNVTKIGTDYFYDQQEVCPSKLGEIIPIEKVTEINSLVNILSEKETELKSLVDGGDTQQTNENINNSMPTEAIELRDELFSKSPYLSDTVMQTAIKNEFVLPNIMIRDILIANPQSATSETVLNELDNRIEPMPDEMYNQILDGESIVSPKKTREMEIASMKSRRMQLFNQLNSYYLADTTGSLKDTLLFFLFNESILDSKYMLASLQLEKGDTLSFSNTLSLIPQMNLLSPYEQCLHADYIEWFILLRQVMYDSLPGFFPDSVQTERFIYLMLNGKHPVNFYSLNLLNSCGIINYYEPYLTTSGYKKGETKRDIKDDNLNQLLKIYPNPSSNFVIIYYNMSNVDEQDLTLELTTIQGVNISRHLLANSKGHINLELKGMQSGVYLVAIKSNNRIIESQKLIVVK